jgi:hypothetical protein
MSSYIGAILYLYRTLRESQGCWIVFDPFSHHNFLPLTKNIHFFILSSHNIDRNLFEYAKIKLNKQFGGKYRFWSEKYEFAKLMVSRLSISDSLQMIKSRSITFAGIH